MRTICDDTAAEHSALDELVAPLEGSRWDAPTPSPGWSIRDQISHLWFFDERATLALTDPDAFAADKERLLASLGTDPSVAVGRSMPAAELLAAWRTDRTKMLSIAREVDPASRVPWYGPAMAARSFVTARLMETWAHGQDVSDALGVDRTATSRLRHVAHIGVRARPFSYAIHGRSQPHDVVTVRLLGPDGDLWTWNETGVEPPTDLVSGPALDFCLVVTQRRHAADTSLVVRGTAAHEWIEIAQAFAGPPGGGRVPGQFTDR
jgi:uncharacterized protein (TIGR03084 family)